MNGSNKMNYKKMKKINGYVKRAKVQTYPALSCPTLLKRVIGRKIAHPTSLPSLVSRPT